SSQPRAIAKSLFSAVTQPLLLDMLRLASHIGTHGAEGSDLQCVRDDPFRPGPHRWNQPITCSPAMRGLLKTAARFAASDAPLAIFGETGTAKEVLARLLHINSPRRSHRFVAVNVAALPNDLLESELFGHGKGAFTGATSARRGLFEEAHQGTLLLDEIGEMPLALQAKLLRVLQDGEIRRVGESRPFLVDVRVFCATHRD